MSFALSKLLWMLLQPSNFLLLVSWAGLALIWLRRERPGGRLRGYLWGRRLLTLGLGGLAFVILLPVGPLLLLTLESRFPIVAAPPARVDGIIVLGGAVETELTAEWGLPSLNAAAERMTTFATLARRYPEARLVFTGGSGLLLPGAVSEAQVARALFDGLGIAPGRVLYEDRSRNTHENAAFSRALVRPAPGETWILITSASHMPRSVGIFRRQGWAVLPWPVAFKSGRRLATLWDGAAPGRRLGDLDWAVHEWVGLIAYRLLGRTDALFPGPD
ncbi:YdcF family protein [Roseomonas sp. NAR14]|uniref:YdcF family protein n=1 Tax=Roseomonas acroporae TaxID=2937791 RepID=A0A9X1YF79_9PROT|nr:YdcF family protein [Roseomonas acroporae]MCK8785116.1 YdcF family protein [Roseomonas acroporae]